MLDTVIGGLIVALVTGVTVLAYKRPDHYSRLWNVLLAFLWVGLALFAAVRFGQASASTHLLATTLANNPATPIREEASLITSADNAMTAVSRGLNIVSLASLYLLLLSFFPRLFGTRPQAAGQGLDTGEDAKP